MALSNETISKLASALVPEVIDSILEDERWCSFLHEIVPDAVQSKLGDLDDDLMFDLSMCIMDRIDLVPWKKL
jgi:energy-converting hydrogenase A subunit M